MRENIPLLLVVGGMLFSISLFFLLIAFRGFMQYTRKKVPRFSKQKRRPVPFAEEDSFYSAEINELRQLTRGGLMSEEDFLYQRALLVKRHLKTISESDKCQKTLEEQEVEKLIEARKAGTITEKVFRREMDRIMFGKYL